MKDLVFFMGINITSFNHFDLYLCLPNCGISFFNGAQSLSCTNGLLSVVFSEGRAQRNKHSNAIFLSRADGWDVLFVRVFSIGFRCLDFYSGCSELNC